MGYNIYIRRPRLTHRTEAFDPTRIIHSQSSSSSWLDIYKQRVKYIIIIRTWQIRFAHRTVKLRVYYTLFSRIVHPQTQEKKIIKTGKIRFFFLVSTHIFSCKITYYIIFPRTGAQPLPIYIYIYMTSHICSVPRQLLHYLLLCANILWSVRRVNL